MGETEKCNTADYSTVEIYKALAKAQAALRGVEKGSRNDYHGYAYASAEDMMQASTEAMGKHGLSFVCLGSKFNKQTQTVTAKYVLLHEAGGSLDLGEHELTVHPDKGRPMDKAISTALTYLQAYTLRGVFNIPRVAEGTERDSQDDQKIAEYNRELDNARKNAAEAQRKAWNAKRDLLVTKKAKIAEPVKAFMAAAGVEQNKDTERKLIVWAAAIDDFPSGKGRIDELISAVDETMLFLASWEQEDEPDALAEANRFREECFPMTDSEKARADAAFEAAQEGE